MQPQNFQSICILGRQPALGLAELEHLYGSSSVKQLIPQAASLSLPVDQIDFSRLGGSTRLARVITEVPSKLWKDVEKQLAKSLVELAHTMPEGKLQLGFSAFGIPITAAKLTASSLTLKKIVRSKTDRSVRITPNPQLELNTAQVVHNHLVGPNGIEMLIIATSSGTLLAQTVAVQDIDWYAERDRERPKRDARVGMLPPKLAQIILNLATGPQTTGRLLDPFCGTGVVLQEALLLGYDAYGTDLEPRMITYSQANLDWLASRQAGLATPTLAAGDATSFAWEPPIDFVATETYLGRPFTDAPDTATLAQTIQDCNLIISKFLRNMHRQLTPGTSLCLAVPAWQIRKDEFKHLPLIDQLGQMGYNRTRFEHVRDEQLLYYREDQTVARQLLVITRN